MTSWTVPRALTVVLLLVGLAIRLALLTGPVGSDDLNYYRFSQTLAHGERFDVLHHHGGRLVFLLLAGVPSALLGSIHAGAVVCVLWLSVRDVVVVAWLSRRTSPVATAGAAGVLAFNGVSATYAGLLLPDGLLSLFMVASALLAFSGVDAIGSRRLTKMLGAGLTAGAAYSAKDTGILILPCVMIWLLVRAPLGKPNWTQNCINAAHFLLGFVCFAMVEMGIYWLVSGDPLYRLHAIALTHNTTGDVSETSSVIDFVRHGYWNLRSIIVPSAAAAPVIAMTIVVAGLPLAREYRFSFFTACAVFIGGFLLFGSSSLTRLIPLPIQDRYFEPLVPFLAICAAGSIDLVIDKSRRWAAATALPILIAVSAVPGVAINAGDVASSVVCRNAVIAIESVHRAWPDVPIYVSPLLQWRLKPFLSSERFAQLRVIPSIGSLKSGFYVLNSINAIAPQAEPSTEFTNIPPYITVDEDLRVFARYVQPRSFAVKVRRLESRLVPLNEN